MSKAMKSRSALHRRVIAAAMRVAIHVKGCDPRDTLDAAARAVRMVEPRERRRLATLADRTRAARIEALRERAQS